MSSASHTPTPTPIPTISLFSPVGELAYAGRGVRGKNYHLTVRVYSQNPLSTRVCITRYRNIKDTTWPIRSSIQRKVPCGISF